MSTPSSYPPPPPTGHPSPSASVSASPALLGWLWPLGDPRVDEALRSRAAR